MKYANDNEVLNWTYM